MTEKTISTVEAARLLGSSTHFIHQCVEDGRLSGVWEQIKVRRLLRINEASVLKFLPYAVENKKIGREMFRQPDRKPYTSRGYKKVYKPDHHRADCQGYVLEHTLVMEEHLGRKITKGEVIHHKNRNRTDNRISNLVLYSSMSEHMSSEHSEFMKCVLLIRGNPKKEKLAIKFLKQLIRD